MNTLIMTCAGLVFSAALCCMLAVAFALGYGAPNVLPEAGETYLGWWMMLVGSTTAAFSIWGVVLDTFGTIQYFFKKNS